ncbi:hypothetical protein [Halorubrum pallidum]|uniref:Transposase n=1 Tax=Halorubrum pallidum TaxID=1526114 RepID=A0ABD5T4X0_9EURY
MPVEVVHHLNLDAERGVRIDADAGSTLARCGSCGRGGSRPTPPVIECGTLLALSLVDRKSTKLAADRVENRILGRGHRLSP